MVSNPILQSLIVMCLLVGGCSTTPSKTSQDKEAQTKPLTGKELSRRAEYVALAAKNSCPDGYAKLQGSWRFVGKSKTPDFSDTITIKGLKYTETMSGRPDGKPTEATITGEIRCLFKNRVLVMTQKVKPEGAFGNRSGDMYPCDVLSPVNPQRRRLLLVCFFDWNKLTPAAGLEFEYEAITP